MLQIGQYNNLIAKRQTSNGWYLVAGGEEVLLPVKHVPEGMKEGDEVNVFVYTDSEDRPVAVSDTPRAVVGDIVSLSVVDVSRHGAFLDWGLEKDLFVPFREQQEKMEKGRLYAVCVCLDHQSGRVIGTSKIRSFLEAPDEGIEEGKEYEGIVFDKTDLGFKVVFAGKYEGLLYANEVFNPLYTGENVKVYVHRVREDGKIDLSLRPAGYAAVKESVDPVYDQLQEAGGYLPYGDHSDPEAIRQKFGMSKKQFKKVIGALYKAGKIEIDQKGIYLPE
ncbi:S1 RNA-binding domain-containing protein [Roseivirga sp. BDSF3-8]|uniref:CvfB family protein n=1 Tax=Roseivirga sp. BDSF3-8 TaxID=3241598 RepID=UPI003531DBC4